MYTKENGLVQLVVKNIAVNTSGSPIDIATISVPSSLTRFTMNGSAGGPSSASTISIIAETAAGSLSAATFELRDAPGGNGNLLAAVHVGPASVNAISYGGSSFAAGVSASTLYLRQVTDSGNAGTISAYVMVTPLL